MPMLQPLVVLKVVIGFNNHLKINTYLHKVLNLIKVEPAQPFLTCKHITKLI